MPDTIEPMSETNPTPDGGATPPAPETSPETDSTAGLGDAGKRALEAERKAKREAERHLKQLQTELEQLLDRARPIASRLRKEQMSDQERAIADAVAQAKAEAAATYGSRLAAAEFRAAAAGRLSDEQVDTLLSALDLKAFLNDDGDVDTDRVREYVAKIAPAPDPQPSSPADLLAGLDLGQGARGNTPGLGTTEFERALRRQLGIP